MTRSFLLILATVLTVMGSAPSFAINDRNSEPACAQMIGNADPRCF
jgi:hypothetical protein